jgi:hypothetical protein
MRPFLKVIEHKTLGKQIGSSYSEDRLVVANDFVAVIDGSLGDGRIPCDAFAALLDRSVSFLEKADPSKSALEIARALTELYREEKTRLGISGLAGSGAMVVAGYNRVRHEVFRVGDCHVSLGGEKQTRATHVEEIGSAARALLIEAALRRGQTREELMASAWYRSLFRPYFEAQMVFANDSDHRFGFAVIDGQPLPEKFVESFDVAHGDVEIVLATDGYLAPSTTLATAEAELKAALVSDPMCIGPNLGPKGLQPGLRSYDDRSYVRLQVCSIEMPINR